MRMRPRNFIISAVILTLSVAALLCPDGATIQAQQPDTLTFSQRYEAALAKAKQDCKSLWANHVFDPLRDKLPLGEEKPTISMLTNNERVRPKDKPLADLAIKTHKQCWELFSSVFSMLPQPVNAMIEGIERQQDALIAELYVGKITFGESNVKMDRISGDFYRTLSGIPQTPIPADNNPRALATSKQPSSSLESKSPDVTPVPAPVSIVRLALVIGNSRYLNLPQLTNPATDAEAIATTLKRMGYSTRLVLDASEHDLRREVRKFAGQSEKADVAVVFYAGHGAQVTGENYLLPIDIEIAQTEADIQLTGLKVDDLVNSIRSATKIVFLDACRDNPVLFKNLVKGRGSHPTGLAPAVASNFEQTKPGGGIFIAYATDSGSVALDGKGKHSPFTEALLRNLQKPISIDDMFSLVTKEVRLVTNNTQRPYKYASLEDIVCLTPSCSNMPAPVAGDIIQQVRQSEESELQIALQTRTEIALETYLQRYPQTAKRADISRAIRSIRREQFNEWTLFEIGNLRLPQFVQLSSIRQFGDRVAARVKALVDPSAPKVFYGRSLPEASYMEQLNVYDCSQPVMAIAEDSIFTESGDLLFHYKWGDPQYLHLSIKLEKGSVGLTGKTFFCDENIRTPMVGKEQVRSMKFASLSSTANGDGEILYAVTDDSGNREDTKELTVLLKFSADRNVKEFFAPGTSIANPPDYRTEVDRVLMKCTEDRMSITRTEFWNATNELVQFRSADPTLPVQFFDFNELSPFSALQEIACHKSFVGVGVRIGLDNGVIKIKEVFDDSPASKSGLQKEDVITRIDKDPAGGLTLEEVTQKLRGQANTDVKLTIQREGQGEPFEVDVTREAIKTSTERGLSR